MCAIPLRAQCPDGSPPPCAGARPQPPVLVVLPFENRSRDAADEYLAGELADDVASTIGASHSVRLVTPRASARAEYALSGSLRRAGGTVRVSVRLERRSTGTIVWSESFERPSSQSAQLAETLAVRTLRHLGVRPAQAARRPVDPIGYDLVLQARHYARRRTSTDFARAVGLYQQALARDSANGAAWAGLAATLAYAKRMGMTLPQISPSQLVPRQLEAAQRALLLDSGSAAHWVAFGQALVDLDPTTGAPAMRALRRAIALDSLHAEAWAELAILLVEADTAGAGEAVRRAVALQPLSLLVLNDAAAVHYFTGDYERSAAWADSSLALDPTFLPGRRWAGTAALALGRLPEAAAHFGASRTLGPGMERYWALAGLAAAAAARGDTVEARAHVTETVALADTMELNSHLAVFIAWGYAALGEIDRALRWLERYQLAADRHFQLHLRADRPLDPLRGDPRFRVLLAVR